MFEKKNGKRFLASVMALVMLLSLAPVGALAADETTTEGSPAVTQPAVEGKNQQAVVDTEDTNENTPTKPTEDSDSPEAVKPEGDLDEGFSNADTDTSNNDSGIVMHRNGPGNGGNNSANLDNRFYIAILQEENPESFIGNEPQAAVNAGFWFVGKSPSDDYTITGETTNAFDNNYKNYINESTFRSHSKYQNLWESQNVEAIADPSGVDLDGIVTGIDANKIIKAYLVKNGKGSENVSDYKLIPYVVKHEKYVDNSSTGGWHIDCQVVKKESVKNISDFTKSVVTRAEQLPAGIENTGYTFPENESVTFSESTTSVTLLYKLTVTGAKDANFTITDESATLVSGSLTGTIPEAGNVDVYVSCTFSANDIKNGYLVNTATIAPNNDNLTKVDDGKDEATANTPATKPETPTPTKPTQAVSAKYFVLLPGRGTPASGKNQGTSYYLPNETSDGGVWDKKDSTGYPGGLTAEGKAAANQNYNYSDAKNGVFNSTGVPNNYLVIPDNLGFFTASNWKDSQYTKSTNTTNPSTVLGETFNVNNVQIIWYAIKSQWDGYHVDGYVAGIPVTLTYHDNFTGSSDFYTQKGLMSGETASIATNGTVSEKTFSHAGYVFDGWYDNADCTGTNYAGQSHTMMDNLELYAKWEPATTLSYTVNYLEKGTNEKLHDAKVVKNKTLGDTITAVNEKIDIAGYNYDSASPETLTIGTSNNVITLYYTKRNDLSYTVNYLEKESNKELKPAKTVNGKTLGDEVTAESEKIDIAGYKYDSASQNTLTIGASNNVITLYYTKRNDLSYTVNYLEKESNKELKPAKTVNGKTLGDEVAAESEKIDIVGYKYDSVSPDTLTIGADVSTNVINVYYTELAKYDIVIHYVDDTSAQNKLQDDVTISQLEGSTYNVADKIHNRIGEYVKETENAPVAGTLTANVEITVVYTKDVLVDSTVPTTDGPGDNIPDKYQVTINYVSSDTTIGRITGRTQEVLTIREDKQPTNKGTVQASGSTAEATGSRNYFSNWTKEKKDGTQVGANTTLEPLEIKDAEGGKTYTFYANFYHRSSSGGGSRPTVTIPDDVPTGLNGKDHYAYIIGYGNNDVRPQNNITRAEVATIFFRLLTDETREANMTKSNGYNDVKDGDWFCCAVSTLSKMGIIKGYEDGSFKPNDPISRAEFAAIAARFDPDGDKTPATFADVTSHWAKDEISIAANHGWIKGYEDGSFKPDQKITRAETMTLVNRVLNRLPEAKDDLHKDMKTWVDNMDETAWYYLAVQEATNSHYFKNKTGTKFEQWTDLRDTRDWSELEK